MFLTSRKAGDLEEAAAALKAKGITAEWAAADASQPDEIARIAGVAMQRLGNVDILINNAGATWGAPAEDHPLDAWDKVMNLNVRSISPDEPGDRQGEHDPAPPGPHHQPGVDRGPCGQHARHDDARPTTRARARS